MSRKTETGIAAGVSLVMSLAASYVYSVLTENRVPWWVVLATAAAIGITIVAIAKASPVLRLYRHSEIRGFYPSGQSQAAKKILSEIDKTRTLTVVGARGLDLIGPQSIVGSRLSQWSGTLDAYLISPLSQHVRLRSGALEVEKEQYQHELGTVISALRIVGLQNHGAVRVFVYDSEPRIRAWIMDHCAFVSFYLAGAQGKALPVYHVRFRDGTFKSALEHYISTLDAKLVAPARIDDIEAALEYTHPEEGPNADDAGTHSQANE